MNIDKGIAHVKRYPVRNRAKFTSFDTVHAACGCRVFGQRASIKFFLADKTLAVLTGVYTTQSTLNFLELTLALPGSFLGYLLSLHGISAGKAAHAVLIKLHRLSSLFR